MRSYELMLVFHPETEEEPIDTFMDRLRGIIEQDGGQVDDISKWGKKRLQYEIAECQEGFYAVMQFTAGTDAAKELERVVRITDAVIRHLLVKQDE